MMYNLWLSCCMVPKITNWMTKFISELKYETCCVCMDKVPTYRFCCRHMCLCGECFQLVDFCPICRCKECNVGLTLEQCFIEIIKSVVPPIVLFLQIINCVVGFIIYICCNEYIIEKYVNTLLTYNMVQILFMCTIIGGVYNFNCIIVTIIRSLESVLLHNIEKLCFFYLRVLGVFMGSVMGLILVTILNCVANK